jgi:polysaccharide pyruvyl transferase WcaK-like protein
MSESSGTRHKPVRIGLLGAAFDTGNMGVSALAESAIKCILHRWPDAEVTLLDSGCVVDEEQLRIGDKTLRIKKLPIRLCRNILLENHFAVLCLYAFLLKVFRWERFKRFCTQRNASLKSITQMDMVADITGGDSFSDIYGMRRFIIGFLRKWLVLLFSKKLVMLPQTYGPFKRPWTRVMARHILKRAKMIYSRDQAGVEYVNALLNNRQNGKVRFAPDTAFILDAREPRYFDIEPSADIWKQNSIVVGLNISGLLFNGGYTQDNMFDLKTDYQQLIYKIIELLLKHDNVVVLLIPHVFPEAGCEVESDPDACSKVFQRMGEECKGRIFLVKGQYNHNEVKGIIGKCDFLIGSRMHACIAALSQNIPAVGIAYSKKFYGVFDSIGLGNCVADARNHSEEQILEKVESIFERRDEIQEYLKQTIPQIKERILEILTT